MFVFLLLHFQNLKVLKQKILDISFFGMLLLD